jgi:hypothetical protein
MRTYLISLLAALALVSCGGGNDVASSGSTAVSAAATSTSTPSTTAVTATPTPTNAEPKVNGQIDERTGVAPVAAQMTIGGSVNYYTQNFGGNSYGAFLVNSSFPCAFGSTPNQAIVSCLNSSVNQFAFYNLNGATYYSQNFGGNSYGVFPINGYYACGFGSTPNQAMVSCLN